MSTYYVDASAWVKYYVAESGSGWMGRFWDLRLPCACNRLGVVEVTAAIVRRARNGPAATNLGAVLADVRRQFGAMHAIPLDSRVTERACTIAGRHGLRGADSVHLASALCLQDDTGVAITLIASDAELLSSARAEGCATLNPTASPPLPGSP